MNISHNLSQEIIDTIHDVCGYNINFITTQGIISASTNPERIGSYHEIGHQVALTGKSLEVHQNDDYHGSQEGINIPVYYHQNMIAIIGISAPIEEARRYAHLAERITVLLLHEQEMSLYDRSLDAQKRYVIRSLMTNDIDNRNYLEDCLTRFHMPLDEIYRMMTFQFSSNDPKVNISTQISALHSLFDGIDQTIYSYFYPDHFLVCIRNEAYMQHRHQFVQFINEHPSLLCGVGQTDKLFSMHRSYQSSLTALSSIHEGQRLICFDDLTLEILTSEIDSSIKDSYKEKILGALKEEEIAFLKVYYENDQSLNQTAQALHLHKNTIQQRLNTITSKTDLNPRHFQDAVLFYLAIHL